MGYDTDKLQDDAPEAIDKMINYFYHFDYDVSVPKDSEVDPVLLHSMIYAVADKYGVPDLKTAAKVKFGRTQAASRPLALRGIIHIYDSTPETDYGLRDLCLLKYVMSMPSFAALPGSANSARVIKGCNDDLKQVPDFAADVATFGMFSRIKSLEPKTPSAPGRESWKVVLDDFCFYLDQAGEGLRARNLKSVLIQRR